MMNRCLGSSIQFALFVGGIADRRAGALDEVPFALGVAVGHVAGRLPRRPTAGPGRAPPPPSGGRRRVDADVVRRGPAVVPALDGVEPATLR
jgi:hypothetical protein